MVDRSRIPSPTLLRSFWQVAEVRSTAPKDAVRRLLDEKKCGKEKLCHELEELRAARKRQECGGRWRRKGGSSTKISVVVERTNKLQETP